MKAPNGKPSKLGEREWAQVRTKAFKQWFGDWEKQKRLEKLRKSIVISIKGDDYKGKYELERKSARKWVMDNLRKTYTNKDTSEKIELSRPGAEEGTSHSLKDEAHLKSLVAIPRMIEDSIFIGESEKDAKQKGSSKYDSYRYYVCGLKIDGTDYTVKVVVGVKDGKKYYDHALTEIEKGKLLDQINSQAVMPERNFTAKGDAPVPSSEPFSSKDKRLISLLQDNSSKVVDENGEPLVVYSGSDSAFNVFDRRKIGTRTDSGFTGLGFYFTPNYNTADRYRRGPKGVTRAFYLDVKNPLIVEGDHANVSIIWGSKDLKQARERAHQWRNFFAAGEYEA